MCGRFYLDADFAEILKRYGLGGSRISYEAKSEIFPSEKSIVVLSNGKRHLKRLKWGFLPPYAKKPIINARSETVFEKPLFRDAAINRRCLIPANGYFEWEKKGNKKEKREISDPGGEILSLGGIYEEFEDKNGITQLCFAILTRDVVAGISGVHNRMPVIIQKDNEEKWLDNEERSIPALKSIATQYDRKLKVK